MANTPRSERLPVLPMDDVVVLPHMTVTLAVEGDSQRGAIEAARQGSRLILLVPRVDGKFGSIGTVSRTASPMRACGRRWGRSDVPCSARAR